MMGPQESRPNRIGEHAERINEYYLKAEIPVHHARQMNPAGFIARGFIIG
jgi:hypothetical protein